MRVAIGVGAECGVESSEMKNIYDGMVTLDGNGAAQITLPDWFEALNGDFRYQLTAVGRSSPGLYISQEISANQFGIAGGIPGTKVSWQVTGVRKDAYAKATPLVVEQVKSTREQGFYIQSCSERPRRKVSSGREILHG